MCCSVLQCVHKRLYIHTPHLQCIAVYCSVLRRVAACCIAGCCSVLQCVAVCCSVLPCVAASYTSHLHTDMRRVSESPTYSTTNDHIHILTPYAPSQPVIPTPPPMQGVRKSYVFYCMPSHKYSHTLRPCASAPHGCRASDSHMRSRYLFNCMLYMNIPTPYILTPYTFSHPIHSHTLLPHPTHLCGQSSQLLLQSASPQPSTAHRHAASVSRSRRGFFARVARRRCCNVLWCVAVCCRLL